MNLNQMGQAAKAASCHLGVYSAGDKNKMLSAMAQALETRQQEILDANAMDLSQAQQNGMTLSMQDRLRLTEQRICQMAQGMREIISLPDPVGQVMDGFVHPNGMKIEKVRVPLGVVAIIFEARPNVTADAAALCVKAGNAVILRGGKEAIHSNMALVRVMRQAIADVGYDADCVQLVEDTSRETANQLMQLNEFVDVLIPRGGAGLIQSVVRNATVPVIETGSGNCHVYVDKYADLNMAADIIFNAKTSRPSVCNAAETLLVHQDVAEAFLPLAARRLAEKQVELRGCEETCRILPQCKPACQEDYATEYNDYILAIRVVPSLTAAIDHIRQYSTGHSECIVTEHYSRGERFVNQVDAAAVYINASTRFTDGGEFGLGAEIGISTQKLHARGPMGLTELTSCKFIIRGQGQIR